MSQKTKTIIMLFSIAAIFMVPLVFSDIAGAGTLEEAIAKAPQGTEKGMIDPTAEPGFLGIPGGPQLNPIIGFLWAIWVGWIFSTVGAFGGIMAGVGHMTIYGLGAYAKTFKTTVPTINKVITDSIRVSNQWLVGTSALVSSYNYYKQKRLVPALGFFLGDRRPPRHPDGGLHHGRQNQLFPVPGVVRAGRVRDRRLHGLRNDTQRPGLQESGHGSHQGL